MVFNKEQKIEGNNNKQFTAETINYNCYATQEESDQGVIDEIFQYVIANTNNSELIDKSRPEKLLRMERKITRNFKKAQERNEIKEYSRLAFEKIALIEKGFSNLEPQEQNDIHSCIFSSYKENKKNGMDNLTNFYSLYKGFIPIGKSNNPQYQNLAKSFVLFFFQDCTIFEKTKQEHIQFKLEM